MNRADLIVRIAAQHPELSAKDIALAVKATLDALSNALAKGERIEILGFGSFSLNHRPPREGRNPRTGAIVRVPAKSVPRFKAGRELRERVTARGRDSMR